MFLQEVTIGRNDSLDPGRGIVSVFGTNWRIERDVTVTAILHKNFITLLEHELEDLHLGPWNKSLGDNAFRMKMK
ncbi:hypothetical protein EYF80_020616 [Liparis tanakae]|uniref:Uncharacterized protein n=1 Tax=Liparis tanakae TaxID=230148 RepID=A0A4Z2HTK7_9TELE|nr:hypothetical protein EYF80_020616 [Liparis tanakae]